MSFEYICLGVVGSYYCCHCYIFIKTFIDEHFDYLKKENTTIQIEAEYLLHETRISIHENNVISLPDANIQTQQMELSITDKMRQSRYRPSRSFISMNESNMLDVLYE